MRYSWGMNDANCKRCGKPGHTGRTCKVTIRKAWPGKHAIRLGLRSPDGTWLEVEASVTQAIYDRAAEVLRDAIRQPET